MKLHCRGLLALLPALLGLASLAAAAELPQKHDYQRRLRAFLATLTEQDFQHGVADGFTFPPASDDAEVQYRHYLLSLMNQPLVGTKRGAPAVNAPPRLFVLSAIESPEAVMVPPVWPETLIPLVQWNYAGNPYYDNRALKLRALVTASVNMVMLDDYLETTPELGGARTDWLGYHLVYAAAPYPGFRDAMTPEARQAYQAGLWKMGRRVLDWGPKGEEPNLDIISTVGLWYVSRALEDSAFGKEVEDYARAMYADPRSFHPAGFFFDHGGIDIGYQGTSNFFASWAALSAKWPFARDAIERAYRLRAHLLLPEPDGTVTGPTHFNSRTSSPPHKDQWEWGIARDTFAALVTDEAAHLVPLPSESMLADAEAKQARAFAEQIRENPRVEGRFIDNEEIGSNPWKWRMWNSYNFPASVNYGYEFYPRGAYAHRRKLVEAGSPLLQSPYLRDESFVRDFAGAFAAARFRAYAALVHSGPVGAQGGEDGLHQFVGPLGFGGGQLSAFWTPEAGALILGRRGGMNWDKTFDVLDQWRLWPIHAVSGCKPDGRVFTSARIHAPQTASQLDDEGGTVTVSGTIPVEQLGQGKVLEGPLRFERTFTLQPGRLHVATSVAARGQDKIAELYETLPAFLSESPTQQERAAAAIELEVGGRWQPATAEPADGATAVRLYRFQGGAKITFDRPRRVMLAEEVWQDGYLSKAACRNILIDFLDQDETPTVLDGQRSVGYTIEPIGRE